MVFCTRPAQKNFATTTQLRQAETLDRRTGARRGDQRLSEQRFPTVFSDPQTLSVELTDPSLSRHDKLLHGCRWKAGPRQRAAEPPCSHWPGATCGCRRDVSMSGTGVRRGGRHGLGLSTADVMCTSGSLAAISDRSVWRSGDGRLKIEFWRDTLRCCHMRRRTP